MVLLRLKFTVKEMIPFLIFHYELMIFLVLHLMVFFISQLFFSTSPTTLGIPLLAAPRRHVCFGSSWLFYAALFVALSVAWPIIYKLLVVLKAVLTQKIENT